MHHISLDFWNTVGKPNPSYSQPRNEVLADFFNVDVATAAAGYKITKDWFIAMAENEGLGYDQEQNLTRLYYHFGAASDYACLADLGRRLDEVFLAYPPTIDPALVDVLARVCRAGITLSIGSNTDFVMGHSIRQVLGDLDFSFFVFSDELKFAKPASAFFERVRVEAMAVNADVRFEGDILHVGDSHRCDIWGGLQYGMQTAFTKDADQTAEVIEALLQERSQAASTKEYV